MGAGICHNPSLQKDEYQVQKPQLFTYLKSRWLNEAAFQQQIQHLKKQQKWKQLINNNPLRKHREKDQYYLGQMENDNKPKGSGIFYKSNAHFYYGNVENNPNGYGHLQSFQQEFVYDGNFVNGRISGYGKFNSKDIYIFEGQISQNGLPRTGTLTVNPTQGIQQSYVVNFDNYLINQAKISHQDGRIYKGKIDQKLFVPQGFGICKYPNNSVYEGHWQKGQFHGEGKFTWSDGSSYEGDYYEGKKHGNGKMTFTSQNYYEGQWQNGKQEGYGILYRQDGTQQKNGTWNKGQLLSDQ